MTKQQKIQKYNDLLRNTFLTGKVVLTHLVVEMDEEEKQELITKVRTFDTFTEDNDPYGEHDFGMIELNDEKYYWKIDYYAKSADEPYTWGSEAPENPQVTDRLLTIMHSSEY